LTHYKAAISKAPDHAPAHLATALLYLNEGKNRATAIRYLVKAAELDPKMADPHYRLCAIYKDKSRAKARGHCETYLKLAPTGGFASDAKSLLRSL
jgi:tetratricopeptide (TPR) repeat protein